MVKPFDPSALPYPALHASHAGIWVATADKTREVGRGEAIRIAGPRPAVLLLLLGAAIMSTANAILAGRGAAHRKRCGECTPQPSESQQPGSGAAIVMGTAIDAAANDGHRQHLGAAGAAVDVMVVATDEESVIVGQVRACLDASRRRA